MFTFKIFSEYFLKVNVVFQEQQVQPLFFDEDLSSTSNFEDHEQSIDLNGK